MKLGTHFFHGLRWQLLYSYALAIGIATCCFVLSVTVLQEPLRFVLSGLLFLCICLLSGSFMARKRLTQLQSLTKAANQWSRGNFSCTVQDESNDELGVLTQQLNNMARQLEVLFSLQQQHIAAEERHRLARDLHDCIKQEFYALGIQLQIANEVFNQPRQVQTHLQEATLLLQNIQEEINNLIHNLHPSVLAEKGLLKALQDYTQSWSQLYGISVHFIHDPQEDQRVLPWGIGQEEAFFRVMQEALSNVAKHSNAKNVEVRFFSSSLETVLSITDYGRGFDPERVGLGLGIGSMQERFRTLGGTVKISSAPGQGTTVIASLKGANTMNLLTTPQQQLVLFAV
jgi:two-component system, NarL family, sensor histidine kinase LiaS